MQNNDIISYNFLTRVQKRRFFFPKSCKKSAPRGAFCVSQKAERFLRCPVFGGGKGKTYAQSLNRFREQLDEKVNIYSMVVPTAGEYYLPSNYL